MFKKIATFVSAKVGSAMEGRLSDLDKLIAIKNKMLDKLEEVSHQRVQIDSALRSLKEQTCVSEKQLEQHTRRYKSEQNQSVKEMIAKTILLTKKKQEVIEEQCVKLEEGKAVIMANLDDLKSRTEAVIAQISYAKEIKELGGTMTDLPDLAAGLEHLKVDIDMTELQLTGSSMTSGVTSSELKELMAELDKKF